MNITTGVAPWLIQSELLLGTFIWVLAFKVVFACRSRDAGGCLAVLWIRWLKLRQGTSPSPPAASCTTTPFSSRLLLIQAGYI